MTGWVLHVDLDQFIAAVEVLRHPELKGLPVVVGGDGDPAKRGVVATASYEAREHGVHSGLPLRTAARRSPGAMFLPADRPVYEAASDMAGWEASPGGRLASQRVRYRARAGPSMTCPPDWAWWARAAW